MRGLLVAILIVTFIAIAALFVDAQPRSQVPVTGTVPRFAIAHFTSAAQLQLYQHTINSLRCLVCNGETVAASNAPFAQAVRQQVQVLVKQGQGYRQIMRVMQHKYGERILMQSSYEPATWLLWWLPLLFVVVAVLLVFRVLRKDH